MSNTRTVQSAKILNKLSASLLNDINKLASRVHDHLMNLIVHAQEHGDVTVVQNFLNPMPDSMRTATIKAWLVKYTPITKSKDIWHMKKNWKKDDFQIDTMEANPYWTLGKEKDPTPLSLSQFLGMLKGMSEKVDRKLKSQETDGREHFKGDPGVAKAFFSDLYNAADSWIKTQHLTPQQLGEKTLTNVVTLPEASVTVPAAAEQQGTEVVAVAA